MAMTAEILGKTLRRKGGSLAFAWLAELQYQAGNTDEAVRILEEGLAVHESNVPGLLVKAKMFTADKLFPEAEALLRQIVELDPMHLAAQKRLVQVLVEQGKGNEAKSVLDRLHELDVLATDLPVVPPELIRAVPVGAGTVPQSASDIFVEESALFASLDDAFLDEDAAGDELPADMLKGELEAALAAADPGATAPEFFPSDDSVKGTDVGSMFTSMFGAEDASSVAAASPGEKAPAVPPPLDLAFAMPPDVGDMVTPEASVSPFAQFELPADSAPREPKSSGLFEKVPEPPQAKPANILLSAEDDAPAFGRVTPSAPKKPLFDDAPSAPSGGTPGGMDLASALDELFGDDDDSLPVERVASPPVSFGADLEASAPSSAPDASAELKSGVAEAFGDMFGSVENDLPIEGVAAPADLSLVPEPLDDSFSVPKVADSEDMVDGVSDALGSLLGGAADDLPVEGEHAPADPAIVGSGVSGEEHYETLAPLAEAVSSESSLTGGVKDALGDLFGESENDLPVEGDHAAADPAIVPEIEAPEAALESEPDTSLQEGVHDALGDLFGQAENDLPVEGEPSPADPEIVPTVVEEVPTAAAASSDFKDGVEDALGELFGADADDLPTEEKPSLDSVASLDDLFGADEPVSSGASTMEEILGGAPTDSADFVEESIPLQELSDSLFSEPTEDDASLPNLLDNADAPAPPEEGASLDGDLGKSLIDDPIAPISETVARPAAPADDSFAGGMNDALTNFFGNNLEEDLSDLMEEPSAPAAQPSGSVAVSTRTLAELYLSQNYLADALRVYQDLVSRDPGDADSLAQIERIKELLKSQELG